MKLFGLLLLTLGIIGGFITTSPLQRSAEIMQQYNADMLSTTLISGFLILFGLALIVIGCAGDAMSKGDTNE